MPAIPSYPDFKPLQLQDRELITGFFHRFPPMTSELTFTNLFIWRRHYHFRWSVGADSLLIIAQREGGDVFGLPPVGPGALEAATSMLLDHLAKRTARPEIHRVPAAWVSAYGGGLEAVDDRDQADYVYRRSDLCELKGRKYHRKRNHVAQFHRRYVFDYRVMDDDCINKCLDLQEEWCQLRQCAADPGLAGEDIAVVEALRHYHDLRLQGGAILVEGKVVAFSLGEPLNPSTAVIHLEKANPAYPGSYAVINQEFCRQAWQQFSFINREQDLGQEGLRRAKLSYYPDHLVHKVILRPRG